MSFLSALKNAFGLGSDYEQEPIGDKDNYDQLENDNNDVETEAAQEGIVKPDVPVVDAGMKDRVFEGVVAIFNSALPDFLQKSVDPQRQAALIRERLDASLDEYLDSLVAVATNYAEGCLKAEASDAKKETDRLRKEMESLEHQRTSIREQQLSADRRRRALADRVTDLEAQLATAEAEKEQYELEKLSLLNKIKMADIQPGVVDEMSKEIERLKNESASRKADEEALAEIERLKIENKKLNEDIAQQRGQVELNQTMYNDLQNKLADERKEREAIETELQEARGIFDTVEKMQSQMQEVEVLIRKRDERIAKLKTSNKHLKDELAQAHAIIEHQRSADGGLFSLPEDKPEQENIRESEALDNLDDDFECPDWFVSEPAPGEPGLRADDSEFGYTEPPKKAHRPENDAQLSLF